MDNTLNPGILISFWFGKCDSELTNSTTRKARSHETMQGFCGDLTVTMKWFSFDQDSLDQSLDIWRLQGKMPVSPVAENKLRHVSQSSIPHQIIVVLPDLSVAGLCTFLNKQLCSVQERHLQKGYAAGKWISATMSPIRSGPPPLSSHACKAGMNTPSVNLFRHTASKTSPDQVSSSSSEDFHTLIKYLSFDVKLKSRVTGMSYAFGPLVPVTFNWFLPSVPMVTCPVTWVMKAAKEAYGCNITPLNDHGFKHRVTMSFVIKLHRSSNSFKWMQKMENHNALLLEIKTLLFRKLYQPGKYGRNCSASSSVV